MWYIRTKWVMIAVRIMMSNLATGRLKTDSWKQRLWIRGAFFFPGTKTHSSCRLRSFMCLRIKPLLTTCLSPKAITGEGAPFQHLNPYAPTKKKKKGACWAVTHSDTSVTYFQNWFRNDEAWKLQWFWRIGECQLSSAHTIQPQGIKNIKKERDIVLCCIYYTAAAAGYFTD